MQKKRLPIWLPYVAEINTRSDTLHIKYKGGVFVGKASEIHSIMLYGNTCDLPEDFLSICTKEKVPIVVHRRNMSSATWITPSVTTTAQGDILTQQILSRENKIRSLHISKKLIAAKFKSMKWLVPIPLEWEDITCVDQLRNFEAIHAKRYWKKYFQELNKPEYTRRGTQNSIKTILDAASKLISGVLLRYIIYHRFSPNHGFLHVPTEYPSLVYDLMEPYRGYFEKVVFEEIQLCQREEVPENEILQRSIKALEEFLDEKVYTEPTRQIVTVQELLHGIVLALRAYIGGDASRFIIPLPSKPNGGRPVIAGYKLYGRSAGPTDFWQVARTISNETRPLFAVD